MAMLNNQRVYFIDCVVLSMHCSFRIFCMCFRQTDSETVLGACIYQGSNRPHRLAVILQIRYTNFTIMTANNHGGWIGKDFESCPLQAVIHQSPGMPGKCLSRESTVNRNLFCPFLPGAIWWLNSYHCAWWLLLWSGDWNCCHSPLPWVPKPVKN